MRSRVKLLFWHIHACRHHLVMKRSKTGCNSLDFKKYSQIYSSTQSAEFHIFFGVSNEPAYTIAVQYNLVTHSVPLIHTCSI